MAVDNLDLMKRVLEDWQGELQWDAFIANLSHELLDPVTLVMGYSDLMLREGPLDSLQREWLEIIFKSSQRITTTMRDLLSVARMQPDNLRLDLHTLSLNVVVDEALDLVAQHNSNYECAVEIGLDIPEVVADQSMLRRVLEQLVDNAIKSSPEGARVIVSADHRPEQSRVVVAVSDQGVGIPPEDHDQIFALFHRLQGPETQPSRGGGLGLYLVREMLEYMDVKSAWRVNWVKEPPSFSPCPPHQPALRYVSQRGKYFYRPESGPLPRNFLSLTTSTNETFGFTTGVVGSAILDRPVRGNPQD